MLSLDTAMVWCPSRVACISTPANMIDKMYMLHRYRWYEFISCCVAVDMYSGSQRAKLWQECVLCPIASSKRLHSNALFEEILNDDLRSEAKRAKKSLEQDETLARVLNPVVPFKRELRASMLSPNLRQRFAHLLA